MNPPWFSHSLSSKFEMISPHPTPRYCAEILASLPFTLPDEPLYLINAINRTVQLWGGSLQTAIKTAMAKGGPLGEAVKQAALELEAERAEEGEEAYNFFTSQQEWQAGEAGETGAKEEGREEEKEGNEGNEEKEDEVFAKLQVFICRKNVGV